MGPLTDIRRSERQRAPKPDGASNERQADLELLAKRKSGADRRDRRGLWAILALALAYGLVMQPLGWAQTANFALVRALSDGTTQIDPYHWETRDKSYYGGHFYSVKAPGLAFLTVPLYKALTAIDAESVSRRAARNARDHGAGRWIQGRVPETLYGGDLIRAKRVRATIEQETPLVWMLGLLGCVLPAALLLLLVRALADRIEPGFGTAAAITLGAGTLVMPFATVFFSHVLSALLGLAAFALAWREREGAPRLALVAAAGLLAGLAVTAEYPLALLGVIIGVYAVARERPVRRALAYTAGVGAGVLPLLLYNLWAFGSITHMSYDDAVAVQGATGHDVLGLNDGGFFGIGAPSVKVALELLFASKGLLALSPVLAAGAIGTVLLYRRRRAEALVIGGVVFAYLVYNSGYYLPFGGGTPGPRFLIPIVPFLALPLAIAYRRFPATTLALALPSILMMLAATLTHPLLSGGSDTGTWLHLIKVGIFEHTLVSVMGGDNSWPAILPVLVAVGAAVLLAVLATVRVRLPLVTAQAAAALLSWAAVAAFVPKLLGGDSATSSQGMELVAWVLAISFLVLSVTWVIGSRRRSLPMLLGRRRDPQRSEI